MKNNYVTLVAAVLLTSLLILNADASFHANLLSSQVRTADEYSVYSVLLTDMYADRRSLILIKAQTSTDMLKQKELRSLLLSMDRRLLGGVPQDLVDDFLEKNRNVSVIRNCLDLKKDYSLLSPEEVTRLVPHGDWTPFLAKYPWNGLVSLSNVGFNNKMDLALVYTGSQSGGKSGAGFFVVLVKKGANWVIRNKGNVWVS